MADCNVGDEKFPGLFGLKILPGMQLDTSSVLLHLFFLVLQRHTPSNISTDPRV